MSGDLTLKNLISTGGVITCEPGSTNHYIDMGRSGKDYLDFHEFGGLWRFFKSQNGTNTLRAQISDWGFDSQGDIIGNVVHSRSGFNIDGPDFYIYNNGSGEAWIRYKQNGTGDFGFKAAHVVIQNAHTFTLSGTTLYINPT